MRRILSLACFVIAVPFLRADQGGFANSGGSLTSGTAVATPPGTLTISGSTLKFASSDGSIIIQAAFSSSSTVESCSGGGKGGHVTCTFTFRGAFSGTLTVNGSTQAINGSTRQVYGSNGVVITGSTGYNSAYTPFYFSNSAQILRSDDLYGTNLISYGAQGSGAGQFYGAYGIALDAKGRIYVSDTYNARIVRIDDMNGANWTTFGTGGGGQGQFSDPDGISIDAKGRIYVMDTGNNRLVRMDDMSGANWTTISGLGSGVGEMAQYVAPVAFDSTGRIYMADTGNKRIVRMDDMNATNWTTLTQSPVINSYVYSLQSPIGVAVDAAGRIYIADAESYQPAVIRVQNMTGANWTSIYLGSGATPHSIAVDSSGMVLVGGGGAQIVDNMMAVLGSSSGLTSYYGPYYVFGATPVPLPNPRPPAISFSPPSLTFSQNAGTASQPQTVTISNIGGNQLNGLSVGTGGAFSETNNCPSTLAPGSNCAVSITFKPASAGPVTGSLNVTDDSGNMGPSQTVPLDGTATASPASVSLSTNSVNFGGILRGNTSSPRTITIANRSNLPITFSSTSTGAPFAVAANTCGASIAAGSSCSVGITFTPKALGRVTGMLTILDSAANSPQTVSLSGAGR